MFFTKKTVAKNLDVSDILHVRSKVKVFFNPFAAFFEKLSSFFFVTVVTKTRETRSGTTPLVGF